MENKIQLTIGSVFVALILCAAMWQRELSISGDNAEYILAAQSVATGQGLQINGVPATKYPPGFSYILSVIPDYLYKYPAAISYMTITAIMAWCLGPIGAVLSFFEPHLILFSSQELPDLLFVCLITLVFIGKPKYLTGLLVLIAAVWLKTVGVVFLVSYIVYKRIHWPLSVVLSVILISPIFIREMVYSGGSAYFSQLIASNAYDGNATASMMDIVRRVYSHVIMYGMWGGVLWVGLVNYRYSWPALVYLPVMLLWPWGAHRILLPAIPFLIYGIVMLKSQAKVYFTLIAALVFYGYEGGEVFSTRWSKEWGEYEAAALWAKENTKPEAVFCTRKASWFQVVSSRVSYCYPFASPQEVTTFWENRNIDYVVVDCLPFSSKLKFLIPAVVAYQPGWEIVWGDNRTAILRRLP